MHPPPLSLTHTHTHTHTYTHTHSLSSHTHTHTHMRILSLSLQSVFPYLCIGKNTNKHSLLACVCGCVCGGGSPSECVRVDIYAHMQSYTHSLGRQEKSVQIESGQRVRGGAHLTMIQSLTFRAHHGQAFTQMLVWFDLDAVFDRHTAHIWMSHGTHISLCLCLCLCLCLSLNLRLYGWWCGLILVPYFKDTQHTYECGMAHIQMSHERT